MNTSVHANAHSNGHDVTAPQGADAAHNGANIADALRSMQERAEALGERAAARKPSPAYDEPWDLESADALMRIYEGDAQDLSGRAAATPAPAPAPAPSHYAQPSSGVPARPAANALLPEVLDHHAVARFAADPAWLDARLADLAGQVERSIAAANPAEAIADLGIRFTDFEARVTGALSNVATRADLKDIAAFGPLDERINGFAAELQATAKQFTRLDAIEAHLQSLSEIAARSYAETSTTVPMGSALVSGAGAAPNATADIQALFEGYVAERQRIDHDTAGALETIQEALVRLIDRADQMDMQTTATRPDVHAVPAYLTYADHATAAGATYPITPPPTVDPVAEPVADEPVRAAAFGRLARHVSPDAVVVNPVVAQAAVAAVVETAPQLAPQFLPELTPELTPELAPTVDVSVRRSRRNSAPVVQAPARPDLEATALRAQMRASMVTAPEPTVEVPTLAADVTSPPAPRDRTRRGVQASVNPGRRALTIAAIGLTAVGIGYVVTDFLTGSARDAQPPAKVAAPAAPTPAKAAAMPQTVAPAQIPTQAPAQAPALAPAQVAAPVPAPAPQPAQKRDAGLAPAFGDAPAVRPVRAAPQRPAAESVPDVLPPPALSKPRSIPESGTDDLTLNTSPADVAPKRVAAQFAPNLAPNAAGSAVPTSTMGISIDTSGAPPRPEDIARMLQRRAMAGAQTSGLSSSSQNSTAQDALAQAPVAIAPVRIDTGSTARPAEPLDADAAVRPVTNLPGAIGPQTLRTAALKGDPSAEFEVAVRYAEGKGVAQSFDEAMVWYQRSANHGFAPAQYRLGTLYERGLATPVDLQRARVWYQRAAEQGNVKAMHNLAVLSAGRKSTAPDYEAASVWFTAAAERGLSDSQFNLAVLMENGLGVTKDVREAYKWFALAARAGDKEAINRRDMLAGKLATADFKAVEDEVLNWRAKSVDVKVNDARVAGDQWRSRQEVGLQ